MKTVFRILLLVACFSAAMFLTADSSEAQSNLLTNGGFEAFNGSVAANWAPWHEERNTEVDCNSQPMYRRPTWGPEVVGGNNGQLWFEGVRSQHVGNQFATWHGGIFRNISVEAGQKYQFSAYGWGRASSEQYPAPSDFGVPFTFRVGIDPTGSGLWSSPSIIWGPALSPHGQWMQASVEATATSGTISLFIAGNFAGAGHCRKHLDLWFDNATLVSTGPPPTSTPLPATPTNTPRPATATPNWNATLTVRAQQQQPTPDWNATLTVRAEQQQQQQQPPTAVPQQNNVVQQPVVVQPVLPTATPLGGSDDGASEDNSAEAEPTAVPTETPVPTNTPAGGTICVNSFADDNANGLRDELEGYMAGVTLLIGQNGLPISQGTSTGSDAPVCFEGLTPGPYDVAQRLPGRLELTTAGNTVVEVSEGQIISLEFGSRFRQDADVVADAGSTASADSSNASSAGADAGEVASETASTDQTNPGGGLDLVAIVGIVALAAAVILLAGILIVLLRRN